MREGERDIAGSLCFCGTVLKIIILMLRFL